jgi:hypothetical protein
MLHDVDTEHEIRCLVGEGPGFLSTCGNHARGGSVCNGQAQHSKRKVKSEEGHAGKVCGESGRVVSRSAANLDRSAALVSAECLG